MNFKKPDIFPFHIFLLPVFFIWHVVNQYFGLVPLKYSGFFLLCYISLSLFLLLFGRLLFRDILKAACWASLLLIIFFFWGAAHDFLKKLNLPGFFVSYSFLLSLVIVFIIVLTWQLRKKKTPVKFNRFLNLLFCVFVIAEAVVTIYKFSGKQIQKNNLTYYNKSFQPRIMPADRLAKPHFRGEDTSSVQWGRPDIFLIIFDEYASSPALREYLHYDNSLFDSMLVKNNFFLATQSKSNYNSTPLSIASFLDLDYFNKPLEGVLAEPLLVLQGQYTIKQSMIPRLLGAIGYQIVNLGLSDLKDHPIRTESFFNNNTAEALYLETLLGRIEKEIWWNVRQKTNIHWKPFGAVYQDDIFTTNRNNYQSLVEQLNTSSTQPRLVIAHFMLPHKPFYFDRNGNLRTNPFTNNPTIDDSLYIDQLVYTNTWIDTIATATNKDSGRPRAVILAGDHGYRDKLNDPATRNKQFMNLNAWYFSDRDHSLLYDSISPVNSFRVILNKYFNANLPLLKDSTVRLVE